MLGHFNESDFNVGDDLRVKIFIDFIRIIYK